MSATQERQPDGQFVAAPDVPWMGVLQALHIVAEVRECNAITLRATDVGKLQEVIDLLFDDVAARIAATPHVVEEVQP